MARHRELFPFFMLAALIAPAGTLSGQAPARSPTMLTERQLALELEEINQAFPTSQPGALLSTQDYRRIERAISREDGRTLTGLSPDDRAVLKPVLRDAPAEERLRQLTQLLSQPGVELDDSALEFLSHLIEKAEVEIFQTRDSHMPGLATLANPRSDLLACGSGPGFDPTLRSRFAEREDAIREASKSVGRVVEKMPDGQVDSIGTAFVIQVDGGEPMLATACHVVQEIASRESGPAGRMRIRTGPDGAPIQVFVEFGDTAAVNWQQAIAIRDVLWMPKLEGCDAAVLRVQTPAALPPPLALRDSELGENESPSLVTVGYPSSTITTRNTTAATVDYFRCARKQSPKGAAKFMFAGIAHGATRRGSYAEIAHSAPTAKGQSGSPVLELASGGKLEVIGIHVCCARTLAAPERNGDICGWRPARAFQPAIGMHGVAAMLRKRLQEGG